MGNRNLFSPVSPEVYNFPSYWTYRNKHSAPFSSLSRLILITLLDIPDVTLIAISHVTAESISDLYSEVITLKGA